MKEDGESGGGRVVGVNEKKGDANELISNHNLHFRTRT